MGRTRKPNGASSIYFGADGWWHGRVTVGIRDDGSPDRRHVRAHSEPKIHKKVRDLEKERDNGTIRRAGQRWTVEKWLDHWLEKVAMPNVRPKTYAGYQTAVRRHLIPGLGAHRLDRLRAEHIENLYAKMRAAGLKPATVHQVHRTLRTALNEASRRDHIVKNPANVAKSPQLIEEEIEPFTLEEAKRILQVAAGRRNGVRFALALALGLRQGEALGLQWRDVDFETGTIAIRRAVQRHTWRHGCDPACGSKRGADCPNRQGGGLNVVPTKSRSGNRRVGIPAPLRAWLEQHREVQQRERTTAGDSWSEGGWVFAQPTGKVVDPRADFDEWRTLLTAAEVRAARLHDARHTAATMLLVLKVPTRAVMDVMGWSNANMTKRYQHVPIEVLTGIATQVGGLFWLPKTDENGDDDGMSGALVPTG